MLVNTGLNLVPAQKSIINLISKLIKWYPTCHSRALGMDSTGEVPKFFPLTDSNPGRLDEERLHFLSAMKLNLRSSRRILGGVCGIGLRFLSSSWFISELRDAPPTTSLAPMPRRLKMKGWVRWLKRFIISVSLVSPKPPSMSGQHH